MSIWNFLTREPRAQVALASGIGDQLASPWNPQDALVRVARDEILGITSDIVTRELAMKVPAVARARNLIVGSLADLPLVAYTGDTRVTNQPTWTYRTSGPLSPWHRLAATFDDLFFYGASLWARQNGADGFPTDYIRVPWGRWSTDGNRILVDDKPVSTDEVTLIPGPSEGLLASAGDTIRGAIDIQAAWIKRVKSPIPTAVIEQTEQGTATVEEIETAVGDYNEARKHGGTSFIPYGLALRLPNLNDDSSMFIEGRNAIRLDFANFANIPASLLDGSTATASLTYTTTEGQRSSFHEQTLRYWSAPFEHRMSMDDVVPRGQRVRFDISYMSQIAPTGEAGAD